MLRFVIDTIEIFKHDKVDSFFFFIYIVHEAYVSYHNYSYNGTRLLIVFIGTFFFFFRTIVTIYINIHSKESF